MRDYSAAPIATDDLIQPFQIDPFSLRGRLVRLGPAADRVLGRHDYPEPVAVMLGETLALAAALSGALKYDGVFTLQTQSDGPIAAMVADVTSTGGIRAYANYNPERVADAVERPGMNGRAVRHSVPRLLGAGHLAFTVDQGPDTERYQGLVELQGATMAECAHHYFRQSEQLDAGIVLAAGRVADAGGRETWRAAAMMIQRLPTGTDQEELEEAWQRSLVLVGSSTPAELLDPGLNPHALLYRLFHEDGVRVYRPMRLAPHCRCSEERVANVLRALPREEVEDLKIDGEVIVTCEFCGARYVYDDAALARLYAS